MKAWINIIGGIIIAFSSTFFGVYLGYIYAEIRSTERQKDAFNALFRIMSKNCEHALEQVSQAKPSERSTPLPVPTLLLSSVHENTVTLHSIDENRMAKLVKLVGSVNMSGAQYGRMAFIFDRKYVLHPLALAPPPEGEYTRRPSFRNVDRERFLEEKEAAKEKLIALHNKYESDLEETCDIFKEIVQKS
jgi:hypothetical protein